MSVRLTTRQCAEYLGVTTNFIRGEIRDGRLVAVVNVKRGARSLIRIAMVDLKHYCELHCPRVLASLPNDVPRAT
jgi:hypothetical protein